MKVCRRCNQEKSLEEFNRRSGNKDGRYSYCKICTRKMDKVRSAIPGRKESSKIATSKWNAYNVKKRSVHTLFNHAKQAGKVTEYPCLICGEKAEAHHADYDRPLDVIWLCKVHHKATHDLAKELL